MMVFLLGIVQAALMLGGILESPEGGGRVEVLLGNVVDESGHKIVGATVVMDGRESTTTDVSGSFTFEQVSAGDHTFVVTAPGYGTTTFHTTVSGSDRFITVTLGQQDTTVDERGALGSAESTAPWFALLIAIASGLAFLGGVFAIRGLGRLVPAIGAVAGMATLGLVIGPVLSFVAFVLILMSGREFLPEKICAACTGRISGDATTCANCGAEYHPACAVSVVDCVVCGESL
ncbi:MAG TPA: carboxypeptidase regulatory-like domain-containing protein [Thermoplasmata archaeon]|nr:carboxypeptidase regulatory-like domain-containing protein [Thermoplasmata archaeon]